MKLVFEVPGPDAPGFLKRQRQALEFSQSLSEKPTPADLDRMVEFLAQFVKEPEKQQEKIDALWMATENEFKMLLNSITGAGDENPTE